MDAESPSFLTVDWKPDHPFPVGFDHIPAVTCERCTTRVIDTPRGRWLHREFGRCAS